MATPSGPQAAERLFQVLAELGCENLDYLKFRCQEHGVELNTTQLVDLLTAQSCTSRDTALVNAFVHWTSVLGAELNGVAQKNTDLNLEFTTTTNVYQSRVTELTTDLKTVRSELSGVRSELRAAHALKDELQRRMLDTPTPTTTNGPARRRTTDPVKFDGKEKDVTKRQEQYTTWRTCMLLNFAEDKSHFPSEHAKILCVLRCLGGNVYTLNQELLDQVTSHPDDPTKWKYATSAELLTQLNKQYDTLDLSQKAAIDFDKLEQGSRPFENFLAAFVDLATKCKKTEEQKVDALKRKVSFEIASLLRGIPWPPKRDDFHGWAEQCQRFHDSQMEFNHHRQRPHAQSKSNNKSGQNTNTQAAATGAGRGGSYQTPQTYTAPIPALPAPGDPMQLDAMRLADREMCMTEGRCFYCKEVGHTAFTCEKKKASDARRAAVGVGGRGGRGGFFTTRGRGRGGFAGFQSRQMDTQPMPVTAGGFVEGEIQDQGKE